MEKIINDYINCRYGILFVLERNDVIVGYVAEIIISFLDNILKCPNGSIAHYDSNKGNLFIKVRNKEIKLTYNILLQTEFRKIEDL